MTSEAKSDNIKDRDAVNICQYGDDLNAQKEEIKQEADRAIRP